jgi:acyl carrier protein
MEAIRQRCIEVFASVMEMDLGEIKADTSPENCDRWDSLSHVQLISVLEKSFGIEIGPEEGIELENVKMICDFVVQKVN